MKEQSAPARALRRNLDDHPILDEGRDRFTDSLLRSCLWGALVDAAGRHRWTQTDQEEFDALVARCQARGFAA